MLRFYTLCPGYTYRNSAVYKTQKAKIVQFKS